jgi:hypothetical protein
MYVRLYGSGAVVSIMLTAAIGLAPPAGAVPYDPALRPPNRQFPAAAQRPAAAVASNQLLNPSFEMNGGAGSTTFADWTLFNNDLSEGSFFVQTGTNAPFAAGSLATVPPPPDGDFAAMSDQQGPGLRIIYQDVTLPPGNFSLSCQYFINSEADYAGPDPETLDPNVSPNQHARIDIMDPSAPIDDVGAGVLLNLLLTEPGDPGDTMNPMTGYTAVSAAFGGGRTIRLRFAEVDNQFFFNFGIDNCVLSASNVGAAPALGTNALAAAIVGLLGTGVLGLMRRQRRA